MKRIILVLISFCVFTIQASPTLIHNFKGYSFQDKELKQFNALLFENGRVIATGQKHDLISSAHVLHQVDAQGATLLPGITDAHGHLLGLGLNLMRVDLRGQTSLSDSVQKVQDYANENPQLRWIQGRGWNQVLWAGQAFPSKSDLDEILPHKPVWLRRIDGHAGWANSAALSAAGIDADTLDPIGGKIHRDEAGNPTGVLIDKAMNLVEKIIPQINATERELALEKAFDHLLSLGITGMHDAGTDFETRNILISKRNQGQLPIRLYSMLSGTDPNLMEMLNDGIAHDEFLSIRSVKLYADGALGSRGALLLKPYSDDKKNRGLALIQPEQLDDAFKTITEKGFQVNVHAIGDRANRMVLDAVERLEAPYTAQVLRHRVEHAQIVAVEDIPRFKKLSLIASMQPTHATSDMNMAPYRLGPKRLAGAYAWRKFLDAGVLIASGSDFPVELANPWHGIYAAVTRQTTDKGEPKGGWLPDERLTVAEALRSFTLDAAYSGFWEAEMGSLEAGKVADFVLIDRDIFTVNPEAIKSTQVLETWVAGQQVYSAR